MKTRIVFMFSGQGSQYAGMGQELYQHHPVFRRCMDEFSEVAFPFLGIHLAEKICFSGSDSDSEVFFRTRYTNPALYMFNYAVAETLEAMGIIPDSLLGYSLGELTAAAYNGTVNRFDLFVRLIRASVSLEQYAPDGGMLAILDSCQIRDWYPDWFNGTSLASVNCTRNFVVSGPATVLDELQGKLQGKDILYQRLPVVQAFHSPWIEPARAAVFRELDDLVLSDRGRVPLYSCATPGGGETSTHPRRFWDALRQPVLFEMALRHLETEESSLYIDVGPSGTLAAFAKLSLAPGSLSQAIPVVDRFGLNQRGLQNAQVKASVWQTS